MKAKLTRQNFRGPWAGLPVAWDEQFRFDESTYREDVARCCRAGIPGVYTCGTSGEFYAMEFDEFQAVTRAAVEVGAAHGTPVMIGVTSTYTLGAVRRAAFAAETGAQAIQVALPFWLPVEDREIVPFFREVAAAAPGLAFSIYETMRAKKVLTIDQHRRVKDAVPDYLMVKANTPALGSTAEGCRQLSEFVNVFSEEEHWNLLGPAGVAGCCSSKVYGFPRYILGLWRLLEQQDWPELDRQLGSLRAVTTFYRTRNQGRGLTDSALDRMLGRLQPFLGTSLRCRRPYPHITEQDLAELRSWCGQHTPELLER
ncbi:MAG: dihydrodipicolinate synthase family protein [Opitutaceae bacterium]|nr:dihydrodipicolinate synthase family protein [Opitutaceae bacterium]